MTNLIENIIKQHSANGELVLNETLINDVLKQARQNCTVKFLGNNQVVFGTDQIYAQFIFDSYNPHDRSIISKSSP